MREPARALPPGQVPERAQEPAAVPEGEALGLEREPGGAYERAEALDQEAEQ